MPGDNEGQNGVPDNNDKRAEEANPTCPCCKLVYNPKARRQKWVYCGICCRAYDTECQKMSSTMYLTLKRKDMFWLCQECMVIYCPVPEEGKVNVPPGTIINQHEQRKKEDDQLKADQLKANTAGNRSIDEKLNELMEISLSIRTTVDSLQVDFIEQVPSIRENTDKIPDFDDQIKGVKDEVKEQFEGLTKDPPKSWADMVKKVAPNKKATVENMKQAIAEVTEYEKEMELRSKGLVIYRAPEENSEDTEQPTAVTNQKDLQLVHDLIDFLGVNIPHASVTSTNRLGTFSAEKVREKKYRPIKVRFTRQEDRDLILKNLRKLKDAPQELKGLSIRQDLNLAQRKELSEYINRAKEQSKDNNDVIYRVRGNPGDYRIVEFQKN